MRTVVLWSCSASVAMVMVAWGTRRVLCRYDWCASSPGFGRCVRARLGLGSAGAGAGPHCTHRVHTMTTCVPTTDAPPRRPL